MGIVQLLFTSIAVLSLVRIVRRGSARHLSMPLTIVASVVWVCVLVFTWKPSLLDRVAEIIGVGRGVDSAVYFSVLLLLYLVFRIFVRLEYMEDQLTRLTRQDAITTYHAKKKTD
jgi:hypothetical protein